MHDKKEAQVVRLIEIFWSTIEQQMDDDDIRAGNRGWQRLRGAVCDAAWKAAKEISAPCDEGLLAQTTGRVAIIPPEVGVHQTQIEFMGNDGWCELHDAICEHGKQVIVKVFPAKEEATDG